VAGLERIDPYSFGRIDPYFVLLMGSRVLPIMPCRVAWSLGMQSITPGLVSAIVKHGLYCLIFTTRLRLIGFCRQRPGPTSRWGSDGIYLPES